MTRHHIQEGILALSAGALMIPASGGPGSAWIAWIAAGVLVALLLAGPWGGPGGGQGRGPRAS